MKAVSSDELRALATESLAMVALDRSQAADLADRLDERERLYDALNALEPYLDAIVCYASSMDEHEPNRLVVNAREALAKARGEA